MTLDQGLIKPYSSLFAGVSRALDAICIPLAIAFVGWFHQISLGSDYWLAALLAALLHILLAEFSDIYRSWRTGSLWAEAKQVGYCWAFSLTVLYLAGQFSPLAESLFAWPMIAQWFVAALTGLLMWRLVVRLSLRAMRKRGFNSRTAAIVGTGPLAQKVANSISRARWSGYRILGFFDDRFVTDVDVNTEMSRESVGSLEELIQAAASGQVDSIYIALPMREELRIHELLARLSDSTASVYVVPDLFSFEHLHARSFDLNGLPAIGLIGEPMRGLNGLLKRIEDIVLSALILLCISPVLIGIAALVKLTSKGPAIFRQKRYGLDGKPIEVWKFRSMTVMENGSDFKQATRNDSRITPVGAFLRKTSLDELPQFINVLQGSMSIVGPRPHAVAHNEEYRGQIKNYMRRHKIKPGITGWAQVNGWRGETDTLEKMQKRVEHDLHYIQHWSLFWDLKIIAKTVLKGFVGKNVF